MNIAVIGAGNVGSALAAQLVKVGHEVALSATDPTSTKLAETAAFTGATAASIDDAIGRADIVVLAVPFSAVPAIAAGRHHAFANKIVIDPTNPLAADYMSLTIGHTTSAGEQVAAQIPGARVVKAFNTVFAANVGQPTMNGSTQILPIASDHEGAKATVMGIGKQLGFDAIDAGPLSNSRYLEPLVEFLIQLAYGKGHGTGIGLTLARQ